MGRREGPARTHHSVGFAGWLALAGRSGRKSPADAKREKRASGAAWSPGPDPSTRPSSRPAPPRTARKQTYFLPPAGPPAPPAAPGPRHSRRGCSNGTPRPPRGAAPAPASGAVGPAAARPARAAMRADSPRLPGGGGTSAPSSGGGHVGPDHVIRRRNALGVKVHRVGGRADPGQEIAACNPVTTCWGRPPLTPPTAPKRSLRRGPGGPLVLPITSRSFGPRVQLGLLLLARGAHGSPSKRVLFQGEDTGIPGHLQGLASPMSNRKISSRL